MQTPLEWEAVCRVFHKKSPVQEAARSEFCGQRFQAHIPDRFLVEVEYPPLARAYLFLEREFLLVETKDVHKYRRMLQRISFHDFLVILQRGPGVRNRLVNLLASQSYRVEYASTKG